MIRYAAGLRSLVADFKTYRTVTKPPKFLERGVVEAHLFAIQTRLFANKHKYYIPPHGLLVSDINASWATMEHCEHAREIALRAAMLRQEMLQQIATRFATKADLRESWLTDNERLLQVCYLLY